MKSQTVQKSISTTINIKCKHYTSNMCRVPLKKIKKKNYKETITEKKAKYVEEYTVAEAKIKLWQTDQWGHKEVLKNDQ